MSEFWFPDASSKLTIIHDFAADAGVRTLVNVRLRFATLGVGSVMDPSSQGESQGGTWKPGV